MDTQIRAGIVLTGDASGLNGAFHSAESGAKAFEDALGKIPTAAKPLTEGVPKAVSDAGDALARVGKTAAGSAATIGQAAKLSRQEMLTLNYTLSDIAASLSSGASPFTILMQQGGQVKDAFGGIGPTFSKLGSLLTPLRLAVGAVGGAVLALGTAYYQGTQEQKAFNDAMRLTGGYAGVTKGQLDDLAASVSGRTNTAIGAAKDVMQSLVASGSFTGQTLESVAVAVTRIASLTGQSADEIVGDFAAMQNGVAKWAEEHNRRYHFLTLAQYEYIKGLEDQGKTQQAQQAVLDALNGSLAKNQQILGFFPWLFDAASKSASEFWGWLKKIGAPETGEDIAKGLESRLGTLRNQLQAARQLRVALNNNGQAGTGRFMGANALMSPSEEAALVKEIADLEKKLGDTRAQVRADQGRAQADADAARRNQEAITAKAAWDKAYLSQAQQEKTAIAGLQKLRDQQLAAVAGNREKELAVERDYQQKLGTLKESFAKKNAATKVDKPDDARVLADWSRRLAVLQADGRETGKLSETQKAYAALLADLKDKHVRLTPQVRAKVEALAQDAIAQDAANREADEAAKLAKQQLEQITNVAQGVRDKADAMQREVEAYGLDEGAVYRMQAARAAERADMVAAGPLHDQMVDKLRDEQQAYLDLADAAAKKQRLTDASAAARELEGGANAIASKLDTSALKNAFSGMGAPLAGVIDKFNTLIGLQEAFGKQAALIAKAKAGDSKSQQAAMKAEAELAKKTAAAQLGAYGDIAGAMKGMFREHSRGYQAMEAAEKVFRVAQLAMAMESALRQTGLFGSIVSAKIAGDQASAQSAVASAQVQMAADQAAGATGAVVAVVNQGKGDPYSAFVRIAAMAAIMAALGFATGAFGSSGSGGVSAQQRQAETGTGTVLGDATAKSESIGKSMEALKDIDSLTMRYSAQMAASLRNIEASMSGLAGIVVRTYGLTTGNAFNVQEGVIAKNKGDPLLNMLGMGGLQDWTFGNLGGLDNLPIIGQILPALQGLWGKTTQSIVDSGILIAKQTVADAASGKGFNQYATVETTESSWFGLKKDKSTSELTGTLDDTVTRQFGLVFDSLHDTLMTAAGALGLDAEVIGQKVNDFELELQRISLRDMNGTQVKEAITAAFSKAFDEVAAGVMGGFEDFQQVGEGYYETVIRLASGVESARYYTDRLGISMASLADVTNKQGTIDAELVRKSIQDAEGGSAIGKLIGTFDGSAGEIADTYTSLLSVQAAMRDITGSSIELSTGLLRAAGGLDKLQSLQADFLDSYYTDAEKAAKASTHVSSEMQKLGLTMPTTKAGFRAIVESLDLTTEAGQKTYTKLLELAPEFEMVADANAKAIEEAGMTTYDVYQRQLNTARDLASAWDGSAASAEALKAANADRYATEKALIKEIGDAAKSIHATAASSIADLQYSVLDNPGKYAYIDKQIAESFDLLAKTTDPALIQKYFGQINDGVNKAFALLPDDQKVQRVNDYIAIIDKADKLSQKQLGESQTQIERANTDLASKISEAIITSFGKTAEKQDRVADKMQKAADTPLKVDFALRLEGPDGTGLAAAKVSEIGYSAGGA